MKFLIHILLFAGFLTLCGAETAALPAPVDAQKEAKEKAERENAVRNTVTAFRTAQLTLDFRKMMEFCSKNYSEPGRSGIPITLNDLKKIIGYCDKMLTSDDLEVIMENALLIQGQQLSSKQKEELAQLKKSGKDKIIAAGVKKNFAAIADAGKKAVVTVSNISADAQSAAADIITKTADGKIYHSRCFLIFSNGKWLVNKLEHKGIIQ
ncbi:MAG: hypothetical protein E7050_00400 [Lentisphaerae bacterium]|nr:hypothetical protein [Lentisphaerota bacterium]